MSTAVPREGAVDALRALALLPVVAVNWVGYYTGPYGGPLGPAQPEGSAMGLAAMFAVAALLASKGITFLTFLFGYSQGLSRRARGEQAVPVRKRRMGRLLALGLLHGLFLYSGDILTLYAVCGFITLRWSGLRLRQLRRRMLWLAGLELAFMLAFTPLVLYYDRPAPAAATVGAGTWLANNVSGYLSSQLVQLTFGLLLPLGLMAAGLLAARLRLFSHPRWRPALARCARYWLWRGLLVNLAWGAALCVAFNTGAGRWGDLLYGYGGFVALPLLAGLVPLLVLAAQRGGAFMRALQPAGRHTLSLYILSSVLSLALFSGAGLALPLGTAALAALALLYWAGWVKLAPRLNGRLPLEAWLSR